MFNKVALTIGLILGVIAVVMVNVHVSRIKKQQEAVKILRVNKLIKKGEMPESRLDTVSVPQDFATGLETAVEDKDRRLVSNRPVNAEIKEGTFLLWSHFEGGGRTVERAIMEVLTKGKRAMSIPVTHAGAVSGWIRPGDYVDVLGTFTTSDRDGNSRISTMTIQQSMRVLAVGGKTDYAEEIVRGRAGDRGYETVVLEVTPHEAEVMTFALHQGGQLTLSLRRQDDHATAEIPKVNWDNFTAQRPGGMTR
ncbi:MAG: Flp pilus assembly protein CpaB [Candidatus Riflebacteria bacterium]|nr:Flp pilus assembly protein CpaB [Candidatus Riflebacteria bacterium]